MSYVAKSFLLGFLVLFTSFSNADEICPEYNMDFPISQAKPVVKVSPRPPRTTGRKFPACVVVSFELSEKPGSNGKGLIPTRVKTEVSTDKKWNKSVESAVKKWLYLAKNVEFRERQYYEFTFEVENP